MRLLPDYRVLIDLPSEMMIDIKNRIATTSSPPAALAVALYVRSLQRVGSWPPVAGKPQGSKLAMAAPGWRLPWRALSVFVPVCPDATDTHGRFDLLVSRLLGDAANQWTGDYFSPGFLAAC